MREQPGQHVPVHPICPTHTKHTPPPGTEATTPLGLLYEVYRQYKRRLLHLRGHHTTRTPSGVEASALDIHPLTLPLGRGLTAPQTHTDTLHDFAANYTAIGLHLQYSWQGPEYLQLHHNGTPHRQETGMGQSTRHRVTRNARQPQRGDNRTVTTRRHSLAARRLHSGNTVYGPDQRILHAGHYPPPPHQVTCYQCSWGWDRRLEPHPSTAQTTNSAAGVPPPPRLPT